jgi:Rrf2 family transcriptional regulator, iron-sulfur cluster assembly transcription factor
MLFSRSAEYAIRALVQLAELDDTDHYAMVKSVAAQTGIPSHFLAKILQIVARQGLLISSKGPTGGFRLSRPPVEISLLDIVDSIDGLGQYERCLAGHEHCTDPTLCALHDSSEELRSRIMDYLERTSLADLVKTLASRRRKLERQKKKPRRAAPKR